MHKRYTHKKWRNIKTLAAVHPLALSPSTHSSALKGDVGSTTAPPLGKFMMVCEIRCDQRRVFVSTHLEILHQIWNIKDTQVRIAIADKLILEYAGWNLSYLKVSEIWLINGNKLFQIRYIVINAGSVPDFFRGGWSSEIMPKLVFRHQLFIWKCRTKFEISRGPNIHFTGLVSWWYAPKIAWSNTEPVH